VKIFRETHVSDAELAISERARQKELERRVRELDEENRFLGKSVAFVAEKHQ
ncbi:hypothetical protein IRT45_35970, partial [Nocardia sp. BSTN01]|nr:hypothetical protein [Nocardia sp. BSTN01]